MTVLKDCFAEIITATVVVITIIITKVFIVVNVVFVVFGVFVDLVIQSITIINRQNDKKSRYHYIPTRNTTSAKDILREKALSNTFNLEVA